MSDMRLIHKNEKGMVLPLGLMFLAIIAILGTTAVIVTTTDLKIGSNYRASVQAFYNAEAGLARAEAELINDLNNDPDHNIANSNFYATSGTIDIEPTSTSFYVVFDSIPFGAGSYTIQFKNYGAAAPYDSKTVLVRSIGTGPNSSTAALESYLSAQQKSLFEYGLFTNGLLDLKSDASIYSYDSRDTPNPDPANFPGASTGEADIGTNTEISTKMLTYIDGDLALGADSSDVDAIWTDTGTPIVTGEVENVERVDSDPLGANDSSSELYNKFIDIITNNDNGIAGDGSPLEGATAIDLGKGDTLTLTAGDYYITDIILRNGSTLEIDATSGPVNIYLSGTLDAEEGELESKNGSAFNNLSQPTDFSIFSNSSQDITFKHSTAFKGMVYAPNAHVELKNSAGVYGLIWGNTVTMHNSGEFYFDVAIKDKYLSPNNHTIDVLSWKDDSLDN